MDDKRGEVEEAGGLTVWRGAMAAIENTEGVFLSVNIVVLQFEMISFELAKGVS